MKLDEVFACPASNCWQGVAVEDRLDEDGEFCGTISDICPCCEGRGFWTREERLEYESHLSKSMEPDYEALDDLPF